MRKIFRRFTENWKVQTDHEESETFSSPTSALSAEETRILNEHLSQQNLFKLIHLHEPHRKTLTLKKFFKMKRNQEVVIATGIEGSETSAFEGKVAAVGRDFVMITNLHKRIWVPYTAIQSANIPFGTPTYSNPHQNHIYDNRLRQKLVLQFGETISKREALVQQFFEESLRTNLQTWRGTWVEVADPDKTTIGKILKTDKKELTLHRRKEVIIIPLTDIQYVSTVRLLSLWKELVKSIL